MYAGSLLGLPGISFQYSKKSKAALKQAYPILPEGEYDSISLMLRNTGDTFILILDEWDSDFLRGFYGRDGKPAVILELKMGGTCQEAVSQIREKNDMQRAENHPNTLLAEVSYSKDKRHSCRIERMEAEE